MVKLKVFLMCLCVLLAVFAAIVSMELYAMERAIARGIFTDVLDDMQDIGYLEPELAAYYQTRMVDLGWEEVTSCFDGRGPLVESQRARKERNEGVALTMRVRPSRLSQWINQFVSDESAFIFSANRPSEYFDPGW